MFPDLATGYGAMSTLTTNQYNAGNTTLNQLIAGVGSPSGYPGYTPGNTAAAANIANTMGISPNTDLNLTDPASMSSFERALTLQETGSTQQFDQFSGGGLGGTPRFEDVSPLSNSDFSGLTDAQVLGTDTPGFASTPSSMFDSQSGLTSSDVYASGGTGIPGFSGQTYGFSGPGAGAGTLFSSDAGTSGAMPTADIYGGSVGGSVSGFGNMTLGPDTTSTADLTDGSIGDTTTPSLGGAFGSPTGMFGSAPTSFTGGTNAPGYVQPSQYAQAPLPQAVVQAADTQSAGSAQGGAATQAGLQSAASSVTGLGGMLSNITTSAETYLSNAFVVVAVAVLGIIFVAFGLGLFNKHTVQMMANAATA